MANYIHCGIYCSKQLEAYRSYYCGMLRLHSLHYIIFNSFHDLTSSFVLDGVEGVCTTFDARNYANSYACISTGSGSFSAIKFSNKDTCAYVDATSR